MSRLHTPAALLPWTDYCPADELTDLEPEVLMRRLRLWKYGNYLRLTAQELLYFQARRKIYGRDGNTASHALLPPDFLLP